MNSINVNDWLVPAITWLADRISVGQRHIVYPEVVIGMAVSEIAQKRGLLLFSPFTPARTPYDCTIEEMEEIYEAGYDLEIKDGLLCGWKARVKE